LDLEFPGIDLGWTTRPCNGPDDGDEAD